MGRFALSGIAPLLGVNVVGAFLMGWGRGVLGGFTSFSTFAFPPTDLPRPVAAGYVVATFIGCVGAWWAGDLRGLLRHLLALWPGGLRGTFSTNLLAVMVLALAAGMGFAGA
ncbi:hypothetical protein [Corynebacterium nasicanis]|uniref:Fluoride ion transporter CrcB n=1 Tax=Corynebacterium nasicanis TaxID=1448267 RepID=A0ABW1QB54_9CORY